jgi:hypothetical protein
MYIDQLSNTKKYVKSIVLLILAAAIIIPAAYTIFSLTVMTSTQTTSSGAPPLMPPAPPAPPAPAPQPNQTPDTPKNPSPPPAAASSDHSDSYGGTSPQDNGDTGDDGCGTPDNPCDASDGLEKIPASFTGILGGFRESGEFDPDPYCALTGFFIGEMTIHMNPDGTTSPAEYNGLHLSFSINAASGRNKIGLSTLNFFAAGIQPRNITHTFTTGTMTYLNGETNEVTGTYIISEGFFTASIHWGGKNYWMAGTCDIHTPLGGAYSRGNSPVIIAEIPASEWDSIQSIL